MITLTVIGLLVLMSCIGAAGLIASTKSEGDAARAILDLEIDPDAGL
ncbi:hypothetical protein ABIB57_004432 [Devosia sp. UYZn731]